MHGLLFIYEKEQEDMSNWISYTNGNYKVKINQLTGTKIRETEEDEFISEFPENIDVKFTNKCNGYVSGHTNGIPVRKLCTYCHEASTPDGQHGTFPLALIKSLRPGSEIAAGGGNLFEYPNLEQTLGDLKTQGIFTNITVNQSHYVENYSKIKEFVQNKFVYGIGVSATGGEFPLLNNNIVVHVINGIHNVDEIMSIAKRGHKKLLILGYKTIGRGIQYKANHSDDCITNSLYDHLYKIVREFDVVSFDNLALEQLNVRRLFTDKQWEEFYMGDDGQFTMYIDLVKRQFAKNSTSLVRYDLLDNIDDMFRIVKTEK